ncbi:hypothetical protein [Aequorivita sp. CIP111184]|uniref:hypothetical protein n=1 Tax=Aequorivita sp. CIP111184 TaxID=2211356 RepID=UPI000DBC2DE7|nr:hypothetical protein [Aequorivita sp. CIP111184]SRX55694.1 hypothetical protein AEQU1_02718 [Aequorivita sp. CIP111184]
MKKILLSIFIFLSFISLALSQNDYTFLNVDYYKKITEYPLEEGDVSSVKSEKKTYWITRMTNLLTLLSGDDEYNIFSDLGFDTGRAYFNSQGDLEHIIITKSDGNGINLISKILDKRFKSHVKYNDAFFWETNFILIIVSYNEDGNISILSRPKL